MPLSAQQRLALRQRLYPSIDDLVFGTIERALDHHIVEGARVLDAGSGTGTWVLDRSAARVRLLVGVDITTPAQRRAARTVLADLSALPFADSSFDVILCYNVIEHLADPDANFRGFARLLSAGGALVFKTPNLTAPITLLSRILPLSLRRAAKGGLDVGAEHVFPTYYRCNTPAALDASLRAAGLERETLQVVDQTFDYLYFWRLSYVLGLAYSRVAALPALAWARNAIIGVYRKAADCAKSLDNGGS